MLSRSPFWGAIILGSIFSKYATSLIRLCDTDFPHRNRYVSLEYRVTWWDQMTLLLSPISNKEYLPLIYFPFIKFELFSRKKILKLSHRHNEREIWGERARYAVPHQPEGSDSKWRTLENTKNEKCEIKWNIHYIGILCNIITSPFSSLSLIRSLISAIYLPLRTYTLSALACHHWLVVIFSRTPWSVLVFFEMKQFRILVKNSFKMLSVSIDRPSLLLLLLLFGRDFSPSNEEYSVRINN